MTSTIHTKSLNPQIMSSLLVNNLLGRSTPKFVGRWLCWSGSSLYSLGAIGRPRLLSWLARSTPSTQSGAKPSSLYWPLTVSAGRCNLHLKSANLHTSWCRTQPQLAGADNLPLGNKQILLPPFSSCLLFRTNCLGFCWQYTLV